MHPPKVPLSPDPEAYGRFDDYAHENFEILTRYSSQVRIVGSQPGFAWERITHWIETCLNLRALAAEWYRVKQITYNSQWPSSSVQLLDCALSPICGDAESQPS